MTKPYPATLTSYDFLKAAALLLMVVDHVGYYFYPDDMWMRVVGRFSAPIWLFLIGYARSRDLSPRLWIGMAILIVANYVLGMAQLPVNILATILLCRLALDPLMGAISKNPYALYPVAVLMLIGAVFTYAVVEYGTMAMLFVMTGYLARNRETWNFTSNQLLQFAGITAIFYAVITFLSFAEFSRTDNIIVMIGVMAVMLFLTTFRSYEYPALSARLPKPVAGVVRLMGRRTLEFYVLHLLLFKALALYLGTRGAALFTFHIY